MATRIETLMRNSASTHNGWTKTTTIDNEIFRSIRIGSQKSCNDDGIICDYTTESKIKDVLKKYNILNYKINNIHTKDVFATEVLLKENIYKYLTSKLQTN